MVSQYCETTETNGSLVALDQEKAYDRIGHKYLWSILDVYGLPTLFIERMKDLYNSAETSVVVNRVLSRAYSVARRVKQGDLISCLLFNLAIEPLATMLRTSDLKGIKIPGQEECLIVKMLADNTAVFMAKSDSWEDLTKITDE